MNLSKAVGYKTRFNVAQDFWGLPPAERTRIDEKLGWRKEDGSIPAPHDAWLSGTIQKPLTIPAGTILTIDRIFIRKGASNFDSVTFWLKIKKGSPITINGHLVTKSMRFWAKLGDVNKIEFKESVE